MRAQKPLEHKLSVERLYQQITELSAEAVVLSEKGDFSRATELLAHRLTLLQQLSDAIAGFSDSTPEYKTYYQYLTNLKIQDDEQLHFLAEERSKLITENVQQKRRTKAVSFYHKVSLER